MTVGALDFRFVLVFISDDLLQLCFLDNCDSFFFEHALNFELDVFVLEGVGVDHRHVLFNLFIFIAMAIASWNCKRDVLWAHSSFQKTLNEAVSMKSSSVNYTICVSTAVCQGL